jgi:type II secretory pathway pseudopilin PulG
MRMNNFYRNENGVSLLELILVIVLVGAALPSLLVVIGQMSEYSIKDEIAFQAVGLANTKMEEICAFKHKNSNWYSGISSYAGTENLADGYIRTVTISTVHNWITTGIDACKVEVAVSHPQFSSGYVLTTMFAV